MILQTTELLHAISSEIQARLEPDSASLAIVSVGDDRASSIYVRAKCAACERVGIQTLHIKLPIEISQSRLNEEIKALSLDKSVTAILLQLPLPSHLSPFEATAHIDPKKDVDGLTPTNMGKLLLGETSGIIPCTPLGISMLLEHYDISVSGKHVLILGRSAIVGKPLAALWTQKRAGCNATVTIAHSLSANIESLCEQADILVAAIGRPKFVKKVKQGAVVIDVGINDKGIGSSGKRLLEGDVDFEALSPMAEHITPVPGGVGPMTIAALLTNIERTARS